ncbi:MAG: hypothetical protein GKC10_07430 [Methanosarcinales archaeon]|nr:hypothetical protein [Methanosarcinales archaeon]
MSYANRIFTIIIILIICLMSSNAAEKAEVRGEVQTVVDGAAVAWYPQNFPGFFYDIDDGLGNEKIEMTITGNKLEEPNGVKYMTRTQETDFEFIDWGSYYAIGFLGEKYFAGYADVDDAFTSIARSRDLLVNGRLTRILIDDAEERILKFDEPMDLEDGYSLRATVGDDGQGILVELLQNGANVDRVSLMASDTYVYAADMGKAVGIPIIAAHFRSRYFWITAPSARSTESSSYPVLQWKWKWTLNTTR